MAMLTPAVTVMRPASALLGGWLPTRTAATVDALEDEHVMLSAEIARSVSQMDDETLDGDALDTLTDHIAGLLARMEELRLAQMLTSRAATDTWLASFDLV